MYRQPVPTLELDGYTRAFAFTLATGLAWLGHECRGGCAEVVDHHARGVWFARSPERRSPTEGGTSVVVDLGGCTLSASRIADDLRQVNRCVADDRIVVRERKVGADAPPARSRPDRPTLDD